jgi:hypothetical protein
VNVARQPQVILAGELADFDVSSLLAAFGLGRQLITLEIMDHSGQADGYIVIKAGRVVSALTGEHTGAEAVRRLLSTERPAHFRVLRDADVATELAEQPALGTIAELTRLTPIPAASSFEERPSAPPGPNGMRRSRTPPAPTPRRSSGTGTRVRVLEGSFSDVNLPNLLAVVSAGRQYIEVHVLDERSVSVGVIELKAGMLVGARTRTSRGLDAAHDLLDAPTTYRFVVIRRREAPRTLTALAPVSRVLGKHEARDADFGFEDEHETAVALASLRDSDFPPASERSRLSTPDTPVPVLDGNFAELDLPSLMQVVGMSRQHTKLRVFDDQRQPVGELHLKSGQLLRAEARDASGVVAVRRLLHSPRDFTFVVLRYPHAREPSESLGSIDDVLGRATSIGTGSFGASGFGASSFSAGSFGSSSFGSSGSSSNSSSSSSYAGLPPSAAQSAAHSAPSLARPDVTGAQPLSFAPGHAGPNGIAPRVGGNWLMGAALGAGFVLLGVAAAALVMRPAQVTTDVSSATAKPQVAEAPAPAAVQAPPPAAHSVKPPIAAMEAPTQAQAGDGQSAPSMFAPTEATGAPLGKPAIASIQAGLRQLGYETGPIDGVLGPRTLTAIKAFQVDEALISDGTLSPPTRARLSRRIGGF